MGDLVRPDRKRIDLTEGRWIDVIRRLNAGEMIDLMTTSTAQRVNGGEPQIDLARAPFALILTYLLDWSLVDDSGARIVLPPPTTADDEDGMRARRSAIRSIDFDVFTEIMQAVTAHHTANQAQKKTATRASASPATLPSLVVVAGATNG